MDCLCVKVSSSRIVLVLEIPEMFALTIYLDLRHIFPASIIDTIPFRISIPHILLVCNQPQVLNIIIRLISIDMVNAIVLRTIMYIPFLVMNEIYDTMIEVFFIVYRHTSITIAFINTPFQLIPIRIF